MAWTWSPGNGTFRYADLCLLRWLGPVVFSVWAACSHGSSTIFEDAPGTPALTCVRKVSSRLAAGPAAWVVIETCPADRWNACRFADRPAYGLDGALLACRNPPKLASRVANLGAVRPDHGQVVVATRTVAGGLGSAAK